MPARSLGTGGSGDNKRAAEQTDCAHLALCRGEARVPNFSCRRLFTMSEPWRYKLGKPSARAPTAWERDSYQTVQNTANIAVGRHYAA